MSSTDLESQVRRSLGAPSPSSAYKQRVRQRANVEVVVRPARSHGMRPEDQAELQAALAARDKSEQALAVVHTTIRNLQTRAAHFEMCAEELREQNRRALARIEILEAELAVQATAASHAKARLAALLDAPHPPKAEKHAVAHSHGSAPTTRGAAEAQTVLSPKAAPEKEGHRKDKRSYRSNQKPIDWWSHHGRKAGRR
jgi:hypothetical protein